ncbi:MAG TPA: alpha/beta hydrolase [Trebonia sp.]|jgi:pimeloyl-ACP methyl ester carboxylesterase|nr:alpha/beta hydrolase [Trebonia sp.]
MFRTGITSLPRKRTVAIAASLAIAGALIPLGLASASVSAHAAPASSSTAAKPTIVLVHGAWADGSSWDGVASILQHDGYTVDVAPNPLRGLTYDTTYLQDYLASISGPIVLVGHSYGGAVITDAATGNANVKALVYDDAYLPALGENITTLSTAQSALAPAVNDPASVFKLAQYPEPPAAGVVDTYLLPSVVAADFAPDVSPAEQALLTATQSPTSLAALGQSSAEPAWKTVPSWDVIGRQDKIIPEAAQLMMAHRAGSHITEIDSSHVSLISHPAEVAAVILKAACATS